MGTKKIKNEKISTVSLFDGGRQETEGAGGRYSRARAYRTTDSQRITGERSSRPADRKQGSAAGCFEVLAHRGSHFGRVSGTESFSVVPDHHFGGTVCAPMVNLHDLASKGDLEGVRKSLARSAAKINNADKAGQTPLHLAAKG